MTAALAVLMLLVAAPSTADRVRVAVASNFAGAARAIADRFEAGSGHAVSISSGSTGKHYAQILHGAPFEAFLAADAWRPELLEREGLTVAGSRFTYALGRLVLWSADSGLVDRDGRVLELGDFRRLAIANPDLAPYGRAAYEALTRLGRWDALADRLVRGENVGQTFQFVFSGNAELGFVAASQLHAPGFSFGGSAWEVPPALYAPIEQQAVLIVDTEAARSFLEFVRSAAAREIILAHGYRTP